MFRVLIGCECNLLPHVEQAAGGATELRREAVGDNLELLDRFDRNDGVLRLQGTEELAEKVVTTISAIDGEA